MSNQNLSNLLKCRNNPNKSCAKSERKTDSEAFLEDFDNVA